MPSVASWNKNEYAKKKKKNETHYYNVTHFFAQKHTFYALHLHDIVTNMKKKWKNEEY